MLPAVGSSLLLTVLSVASVVGASPWRASPLRSRTPYSVKDTHNVPKQWSRVSSAPKDHVLKLQIALKQSNFDELERHLYEVSDPSHSRYGQHLTVDEVNELVKPSDDALSMVEDWLFANHCNSSQLSYSPAKDFISVTLPVDHVENLLNTEYSVYQHNDGTYLVRTPEWSLPKHLHEHIESIQPTNSFFRPKPRRSHLKTVPGGKKKTTAKKAPAPPYSNITVAEACDSEAVTSLCLRTLYQTIDYTPQVPGLNKVGLNNFLGEGMCYNENQDLKNRLFPAQLRQVVKAPDNEKTH